MHDKLWERYIELVKEVNAAKTEQEHRRLDNRLYGFHEATVLLGYHFGTKADLYYIDRGIDRPMCCGVFLDWQPE